MTFLLENPKGDAAFAKLMAAPVSAPRTKIPRAKVAPKASRPSTGTSLADILASKAARRSRSSWPSYRKQTIAALIAAGEFDYLDSLGIFCVRHEECAALSAAETTFHNVTITIAAATPREAYARLCDALAGIGECEWATDTYSQHEGPQGQSTARLFPGAEGESCR